MAAVSHDPRGLVDTTPGGSVNEATASLARELSAGGLAASRTDLNLKKAGLSELPPQIGTRACVDTHTYTGPQPRRTRDFCVLHARAVGAGQLAAGAHAQYQPRAYHMP